MQLLAYRLIWILLDWLFPPSCAGCKKIGFRWCPECQQTSPIISNLECIYCRNKQAVDGVCDPCAGRGYALDKIFAWGWHTGPLRQALQQMKYNRDLGLGEVLSRHITGLIEQSGVVVDLVVPVPLGKQRLKERGYNQAALLARPTAWRLAVHCTPKTIKRVKETRTQVGLSLSERKENVENAFLARQDLAAGKRILLVDDVMTTGATLIAAGQALKDAGADRVYGFVLAHAM